MKYQEDLKILLNCVVPILPPSPPPPPPHKKKKKKFFVNINKITPEK